MAKLSGLIRLKKHELDQYRQALAVLQDKLNGYQERKDGLLRQLEQEKNLASVDMDAARNFNAFLQISLDRLQEMERDIHLVQQEIQAARRVIQDAYMEVKKLDITEENRAQAERDELNRKISNELDDIGLTGFMRNRESAE
jgi:flagellar FliJ protein